MSCGTGKQEEHAEQIELISEIPPEEIDSIATDSTNYVTEEKQPPKSLESGMPILVDKIHLFETGEPYVWIALKEGYDWKAMDSLSWLADSVIFEEEFGVKRTRFPMKYAKEYLNLKLLDSIAIFNFRQQFQGHSRLKRIEYYEDVLGEQFVAVLQPPSALVGNQFYGISGTATFDSSIRTRPNQSSHMKKRVAEHVTESSKHDLYYGAMDISPDDLTYAFYSFYAEQGQELTYLIELEDNQTKTLFRQAGDYSILSMTPVKLRVTGRPVLLLWVGVPETDIEWFSPAIYNGQSYEITNDRVIMKEKKLALLANDVGVKSIELIDTAVVVIALDSVEIGQIKRDQGEDDFYTAADDLMFYNAQMLELMDSLGIEVIYAEWDSTEIRKNGTSTLIVKDSTFSLYTYFLVKGTVPVRTELFELLGYE